MKFSARIFVFALTLLVLLLFPQFPLFPLPLPFSSFPPSLSSPLSSPSPPFPLSSLLTSFAPFPTFAASAGEVVINEVAWMGTAASSSDEWIELLNTTDSPVDISGWSVFGADTGECLDFSDADGSATTIIAPNGYLIYANDEDAVKDNSGTSAVDIWDATIGMNNTSPGQLILYDAPGCGGNIVDAVGQTVGDWFAGQSSGRISMERIDPVASGEENSNWADNDGVTVNGQDANGDSLTATPKAQNSVYGQPPDDGDSDEDFGITFTLPSSVTAGEGFDVPVTVVNADPSGVYYAKAVIGESTESASLCKGYTYNSVLDKWLAWNGKWEEMPTFTADADGSASFVLKSKVKDDASSGTYYFLVRIRKIGTDDNLDSEAQTFFVNAAPDTSNSSNDPQVTFSVEDSDLKINQPFDVKVEIKNAKPLHDYCVKIRLGPEESKMTKGRTYNGFFQDWLADNASWSKFPVVYTDGNGSETITVSAKVASGDPAGTYIIGVRMRDKETEDNYDSATQTIEVSEELLESVADPSEDDDETGEVLGTLAELPATGNNSLGLSLFGLGLGLLLRSLAESYILVCDRMWE